MRLLLHPGCPSVQGLEEGAMHSSSRERGETKEAEFEPNFVVMQCMPANKELIFRVTLIILLFASGYFLMSFLFPLNLLKRVFLIPIPGVFLLIPNVSNGYTLLGSLHGAGAESGIRNCRQQTSAAI